MISRCWAPALAGAVLASSVVAQTVAVPSSTAPLHPLAPAAARPAPAPVPGAVPPGMQYLYGSGEAAAISVQAWRGLVDHVARAVAHRPADSVVLDEGATLAAPRFVPCGEKPLAAVFDVDETVLLNLGFESDDAAHPGRPYDPARWRAWEVTGAAAVVPTPGAANGLAAIRAMGVTVIFNTNRSAANAAYTEQAIDGAGIGPAVHKQTLWLQGDDDTGPRKDARRRRIADTFCVVAMAGDQLGDFSDLFNTRGIPVVGRRTETLTEPVARLWGAGWFVLPNPVYGTALAGSRDDVFPADKRWTGLP